MKAYVIATDVSLRWLRPSYRKKVRESGAIGFNVIEKYLYIYYKDTKERAQGLEMLRDLAEFNVIKEEVEIDDNFIEVKDGN